MRLAFDTVGHGPRTLVLLHGFTGSRESWHLVEPLLQERFTLVRVDLPGHGASPLPDQSGAAGFEATLDALERVLDEVGADEVHLAGYSQGARVALGLALRARARVGRLVLESGTAGLHRRGARRERRQADEALARDILRDGVVAFTARWEALPLFAGLRRLPPPALESLRARRTSATAEGLAGALGCLGLGVQPDYWTRLWDFRRPTLLLTGVDDPKFTTLARKMAAELPLGWSCALAGAGHAPHLEAPLAWAREVIPFLETPFVEAPQMEPDSWSAA
jgi:2-succinyl-6-hydroxy-2,4-cyclohexadiene-1-carboxylate synthase